MPKFPTDIPDEFYDELTRKILDRYDNIYHDRSSQEMLSKYIPNPELKREIKRRDWSNYNAAQTQEKLLFMKIIHDVVESIREPPIANDNGRPPKDKYDIIKILCYKAYAQLSSRRMQGEIEIMRSFGYVTEKCHFNSLNNYLNDQEITFLLHKIYKLLAKPLFEVEEHFAIDASGFSTFNKKKWLEVRLDFREHKQYRKLHIICGVKTNIISHAVVSEGTCADSPFYEDLLLETAKIFNVKEISADSAYLSRKNCQIAEDIGAIPFIKPKKNIKSRSKGHYPAWNKMIWLWKNNKDYFRHRYHLRSNVECSFSMIKRKFGSFVRSKRLVAQENEILCKVICHNSSILIWALLEFDIEFYKNMNKNSQTLNF